MAEDAFAYFVTKGLPQLAEEALAVQRLARDHGLRSVQLGAVEILNGLLDDVNRLAVKYTQIADEQIVAKIHETRAANRPQTGEMATHIRSEPGPAGTVLVGLIAELNRIVNSRGWAGWGTFWRAQEYGTGSAEVRSQIGRPLYGTFEPSGEPPDAAQRGLGEGRDLAFNASYGVNPGFGRISVELPGRHFLRDGSTEAGERYVVAMAEIQAKWVARIRLLIDEVRRQMVVGGGGAVKGIIEA